MTQESFIDEPVAVEASVGPQDQMRPKSFRWQGKKYVLAGLGRQWQETVNGRVQHCYLAETTGGDRVELRWLPQTKQWRLRRAWWRTAVV